MRRVALAVVVLATGVLCAPSASAADIYAYANGCYALQGRERQPLRRPRLGSATRRRRRRSAPPPRSACRPPRSAATCSTGRTRKMPATSLLNSVAPTGTPGPPADWRVQDVGGKLKLISVSTGKELGVNGARPARPGRRRRRRAGASRPPRAARSSPRSRSTSPDPAQGLEPDGARCAASSTTTSTSAPSSSSAGASTAAGPGARTA